MENIKMEDIVEKTESTSDTVEKVETTETTDQGPLKTELDRVQKKEGRTELEKAAYSLQKNAERLKELGGDPTKILGIGKAEVIAEEEVDEDDEKPVTVGMLKRMEKEKASKTAFQSADEIENETERELVKYHLKNTIKSTGNPTEDLKLARALVNSVKNSQIIKETERKTPPKTHSNSSGVDAKKEEEIVFTPTELQMMGAPFNMTQKEILDARAGKKFSFKK